MGVKLLPSYGRKKLFRLSETDEKLLIEKAEASGVSQSAYLRRMLTQQPTDYPEIRLLLKQLVQEVNAVGNNINQIAKNNNSGFYSPDDKRMLTAYMKKLVAEMRKVQEEVKGCGNIKGDVHP